MLTTRSPFASRHFFLSLLLKVSLIYILVLSLTQEVGDGKVDDNVAGQEISKGPRETQHINQKTS